MGEFSYLGHTSPEIAVFVNPRLIMARMFGVRRGRNDAPFGLLRCSNTDVPTGKERSHGGHTDCPKRAGSTNCHGNILKGVSNIIAYFGFVTVRCMFPA